MAQSNNKVYYGEYSLMRWTELILHGGVVLPPETPGQVPVS